MANSLSRTRRAVVGWCLILAGVLIPITIGFLNPDTQRLSLLFAYDWLNGLAVAAILIGLPLAVSE